MRVELTPREQLALWIMLRWYLLPSSPEAGRMNRMTEAHRVALLDIMHRIEPEDPKEE